MQSKRTSRRSPNQLAASRHSHGPSFWVVVATVALSLAAVYGPALDAPFIFDDAIAIQRNESIHSLWPLFGMGDRPGPLNLPLDNPVSGRPLVNLTFAINYAIGGDRPAGYHAVNVAIHFCSVLLLWAVVRRTLQAPYFAGRFDAAASWLALTAAMIWALHPLTTEAVIYVSQRTELMMALFYLATLYCSLRYWSGLPRTPGVGRDEGGIPDTRHAAQAGANTPETKALLPSSRAMREGRGGAMWLGLAVLACACGMASKEVMVSAPLVVLLFERSLIAGSFREALRRSWPLYAGLSATWLLLLWLNVGAPRSHSAGFHLGVDVFEYWLTQTRVLALYWGLIVKPWPLLIHYEIPYLTSIAQAWPYVLLAMVLVLGTLLLLWRNRPIGFLGAFVFAILAPTSVVPIVTEIAAERRMYLPLAAIVCGCVVGSYVLAKRWELKRGGEQRETAFFGWPAVLFGGAVLLMVGACGVASAKRVDQFHNPLAVWDEVLRVEPNNSVAHENRGYLLRQRGDLRAAIDEYREAVRLHPKSASTRFNLSKLLLETGALDEAATELKICVGLSPDDEMMRNNLGGALYNRGRYQEASIEFREAVKLAPNNWIFRYNLGQALQKAGKNNEAIESFQTALRLNPHATDVYLDLADTLTLIDKPDQAKAILQEGLRCARAAGDASGEEKLSAQLHRSK